MSKLTEIEWVRELGTTPYTNIVEFETRRNRLGDMDVFALSLDTGSTAFFSHEIASREINLKDPLIVYRSNPEDKHKTTEAYYATNQANMYLRIFLRGDYTKQQLAKVLEEADMSRSSKSGIIAELEAVGPVLGKIFEQSLMAPAKH